MNISGLQVVKVVTVSRPIIFSGNSRQSTESVSVFAELQTLNCSLFLRVGQQSKRCLSVERETALTGTGHIHSNFIILNIL
jgi:hypothetical protein